MHTHTKLKQSAESFFGFSRNALVPYTHRIYLKHWQSSVCVGRLIAAVTSTNALHLAVLTFVSVR